MLERLRELDNKVLGPPRPTRWWQSLGGLFGWLGAYGALHVAEPRASWYAAVPLVVGLSGLAWYTVTAVRDPARVGRHSDVALPPVWIGLGILPLLFEPRARQAPYLVLYVVMVLAGILSLAVALRRRRGMAVSG